MSNIIYTPFDLSDAKQVGRRQFWKQVLPVTSIDYEGQKVDFDEQFHMDLSKSFEGGAFDQVPIVFADGGNRHNMDPRNFGGDVVKMEYRGPAKDQGTWALIEADRTAARAIKRNPRLGVSARIRQMISKADGRSFPRAIEHICLTMNPRVTGMGPWQAVDLSEADTDIEVVDLTAANYEEGTPMARKTTSERKQKASGTKTIDLSAISDEQFQYLLDLAEDPEAEVDPEDLDDDDLDDEEEETPPTGKRRKKSKTKVTVEEDSEEDDGEDTPDPEDDDVDLSEADKVIRRSEVSQFQQMRIDLAENKWAGERVEYLNSGVPAFLLDLAEPVLSQPDEMTIDLSDDESVNATKTIREMLDGVKGVIDMGGEFGHQYDLTESASADDDAEAFNKAWDQQYG